MRGPATLIAHPKLMHKKEKKSNARTPLDTILRIREIHLYATLHSIDPTLAAISHSNTSPLFYFWCWKFGPALVEWDRRSLEVNLEYVR